MSARAVGWALDARLSGPMSAEARLVLVALADHAHEDGTEARPGKASLARRLGISPRAVQRSLAVLRDKGAIRPGDQSVVSHLPSDKRPTVYDLPIDTRLGPFKHGETEASPRSSGETPATERGDVRGQNGETEASPKPKTEPTPETTPQTPRDADDDIDHDETARLALEHSAADALMRSRRPGLTADGELPVPAPPEFRQALEALRSTTPTEKGSAHA